ncbi:hypothetical protein ACFWZW_00370 [Microbacterium enclense]|uniref:hypothetical protein n=1 Tax=Microbacterium enclense TaxID=993073 RepID=UPI0036DCB196
MTVLVERTPRSYRYDDLAPSLESAMDLGVVFRRPVRAGPSTSPSATVCGSFDTSNGLSSTGGEAMKGLVDNLLLVRVMVIGFTLAISRSVLEGTEVVT